MTDDDWLARRFEEHRPQLRAVASGCSIHRAKPTTRCKKRGSGSAAPTRTDREPRGMADHRREPGVPRHAALARARRAHRLPTRTRSTTARPPMPVAIPSTRHSSPTRSARALQVVLDTLAPAERLAFVLHDVFAVPFDEIGTILGRSPNAAEPARQPRSPPDPGNDAHRSHRPGAATHGRRRVPRCVAPRRLRPAPRGARPRHRAAGRRRGDGDGIAGSRERGRGGRGGVLGPRPRRAGRARRRHRRCRVGTGPATPRSCGTSLSPGTGSHTSTWWPPPTTSKTSTSCSSTETVRVRRRGSRSSSARAAGATAGRGRRGRHRAAGTRVTVASIDRDRADGLEPHRHLVLRQEHAAAEREQQPTPASNTPKRHGMKWPPTHAASTQNTDHWTADIPPATAQQRDGEQDLRPPPQEATACLRRTRSHPRPTR